MNQSQVKDILMQIEETELEFSVLFTGKISKKVNGLYKVDTHEILLHNKNFSVDNELLYTAIHEYTHHRLCEIDGGGHSSRSHTRRFWSYFHNLLKKAEEKGLYKITLEESPDLLELTEHIRTTVMVEDGRLMKELGRLLGKARTLCKEAGVRYEDYIDRVLCLPRAAAASIEKVYAFDVNPALGYETMKVVANIGSQDKRSAAEELLLNNNSPAFAQTSVAKKQPDEEPRRKLEKEKRRLENTIASLTARLGQVEKSLANMSAAPFVLCVVFFAASIFPCYADSNSGNAIVTPIVPDVPSVTVDDFFLLPPTPPRITPPVFQPIQINKHNSIPDAKRKKNTKKTAQMLSGMTARTISGLTKEKSGLFQLQDFLGGVNTSDEGSAVLTTLLNELEKLQKNAKAEPESDPVGVSKTAKKNDAVQLVRLRINGHEITDELVYTVCSALSEQKDFLYSVDRRFKENGEAVTETLYFFCRKQAANQYEITVAVHQKQLNTQSAVCILQELSPLLVQQTSDMLFWHYQAPDATIELLFRFLE